MELFDGIGDAYLDFAAYAVYDSPCFADWANGVAGDPEVMRWLLTLPPLKRQPNLVFAAARWHGTPAPGPYRQLREALLEDGADGPIRQTIMERVTQTNEVGRLATLVPALNLVRGVRPLALLEVGASAGLCLYPDRWAYAWLTEDGPYLLDEGGLVMTCAVRGNMPVPTLPEVSWRGGIDLHPLDVRDIDAMDWLEILTWPEQLDRLNRLREAIRIARSDPPRLVEGDLMEKLPGLVEEAARYGDVVVFHSAVAAYLQPDSRREFVDLMMGLVERGACHWISNEGKRVLPSVTRTGPPVPSDLPTFVLGIDGQAVAWTNGHGRSLNWVA